MHDPSEKAKKERDEMRRKGGMNSRKIPPEISKDELFSIHTLDDLEGLYNLLIKGLWEKSTTVNGARAIAEIGSKLRDSFELRLYAELAQRVGKLEGGTVELLEGETWER